MRLSEEANERLWDALITEALIQDSNNELAELRKNTDPCIFSERFEKNIAKIERQIFGRKSFIEVATIFRNIAAAIMIVIGLSFVVLLTQPEVYAAVENVIRSIFSDRDKYTYQGETKGITFNNNIRLGYIPDGYEIRMAFYSTYDMYLTYESTNGETMEFDYGLAENSSITIDNERHKYYELKYGDVTYYFYEAIDPEADSNILLWYLDGYVFSIDAQLNKNELVKIAENIKW